MPLRWNRRRFPHLTSLEVDLLVATDPWQTATPELVASSSVAGKEAELSDNSFCIGKPLASVGVQTASAAELMHDSVTEIELEAIAADSFTVPTAGAPEVATSLADCVAHEIAKEEVVASVSLPQPTSEEWQAEWHSKRQRRRLTEVLVSLVSLPQPNPGSVAYCLG